METEREMSRYEVTPIGIFLETWDGSGGIKRECILPRDRFVEAYEKWIKNAPTEKIDTKSEEYNAGYEDGTKARDGERGSIYYGGYGDGLKDGYEKGLKHGQELRAKEAECAEACGMKRAWQAVRKIIDMPLADLDELYPGWDVEQIIEKLSAKEVIEKIETWKKKQEQTEKRCTTKALNEYRDEQEEITNEIKIGDEVRCKGIDYSKLLIVTRIYRDRGKFDALGYDGTAHSGLTLNLWEKTGQRCEIEFKKTCEKGELRGNE